MWLLWRDSLASLSADLPLIAQATSSTSVKIAIMTACTVTSVVGFPKLNEWAGVAQNQSGSLVLAFAIQGDGASNLGKDLLDQLHEFEPHSAQDFHQGLLDLLSQVRHTHCAIQFSAALIGSEKVVFGSFGGSVTLKKPTKVQELIGGDDQLRQTI